jgi:hypothetical protein
MANIKISELTPKGSNLASTDLLEISEDAGGGTYVTKSVTGDEIRAGLQETLVSGTNIKTINSTTLLSSGNMNLVAGLSGNSPINTSVLTGGIGSVSIDQADSTTDGYLSSSDWNTFNGKQAFLSSGTNIKTINGNSVLGSGNLTISGGGGIHVPTKPITGMLLTLATNTHSGIGGTSYGANNLNLFPFIPLNGFTCDQISINVNTLAAGGIGRVSIYSDLNGRPNTLIYTSANIDCSTTGIKTLTVSQTFAAGTSYWFAWNQNNATIQIRATSFNWSVSIASNGLSTALANQYNILSVAVGSEPATITGITTSNLSSQNIPLFYIRSI